MKKTLEEILKSRFTKEELISFIESDSKQFMEAIDIALKDEQPLAWNAAWGIDNTMKVNDERLHAHIPNIINTIPNKIDGYQRQLLKILLRMEINEENEGQLFDICVSIWEKISKKPSVRITAFQILKKIANKYPDLNNEIEFLTQDHYTESLSPGIKHSFDKLNKKNSK